MTSTQTITEQVQALLVRGMQPREVVLHLLPKSSVGAEIGVHEGDFSAAMLQVAQPKRLHLIDPWQHEPDETYKKAWYGGQVEDGQAGMDSRFQRVRERFQAQAQTGQVAFHRMFSDQAAAVIEDGSLGWAYIDGNHLYEYVLKDLQLYYEKVRPGGILAGDDYGQKGWWEDGVTRALEAFTQTLPGVHALVIADQFLLQKPLE